jgi:hypothetical protein
MTTISARFPLSSMMVAALPSTSTHRTAIVEDGLSATHRSKACFSAAIRLCSRSFAARRASAS